MAVPPDPSSGAARRDPFEVAADEYFELRRRGAAPAVDEFAARHPDVADRLRTMLPLLTDLEEATGGPSASGPLGPGPLGPDARLGDYRIVREIGRGGMGIVYEARHDGLDRRVALKLLPPQATLDPRLLERFRREARAAARLSHPGIVPVHGVGESDGYHYYAMQFVDGDTLDRVLERVREAGPGSAPSRAPLSRTPSSPRPSSRHAASWHPAARHPATRHAATRHAATRPPSSSATDAGGARVPDPVESARAGPDAWFRAAARLALQAADALAHAHGEGVVHRDVKPGNLILDRSGRLCITDFGLCTAEGAVELTRTTDLLGTLRYMAPEQLRGSSDARSDVYGLGLVLYELLARRPAWPTSDRAELARRVLDGSPPRLRRVDPRIPRDLETIVLKAIDREPELRYATAAAMAADLRAFLEDRPVSARRPSLGYLLRLAARRNRAATVAAAVVAAVLVLSIGAWIRVLDAQRRTERAQRVALERRNYVARIAAAHAAITLHRVAPARRHLEQCPPRLRAWEWRHLRAQLDASVATLPLLDGTVWDLAWSADGARLGAVGQQGPQGRLAVAETDPAAGPPATGEHPEQARSIVALPDGGWITGCHDGRLRVWGPGAGEPRLVVDAHDRAVSGLALGRGGRLLVSVSEDGSWALWETGARTPRLRGAGREGPVWRVAMHPDGDRFATSGQDNTVRVWSTADGSCLAVLEPDPAMPETIHYWPVAYDPRGEWLAWAEQDGTIRVVDAGTHARVATLPGHRLRVWGLGFFADGRTLVSAGRDRTLRVWDVVAGRSRAVLAGHDHGVTALAIHPSAPRFASGGADGAAKVWSLPAEGASFVLGVHERAVFDLVALDTRRLVSAGEEGVLRVWDVETREVRAELRGHPGMPRSLALSPARDRLVSTDRSGWVIGWDPDEARELWRTLVPTGGTTDVAWHPRGDRVVVTAGAAGLVVLDPADGSVVRRIGGLAHRAHAVDLGPAGRRVVASGDGGTIEMRAWANGALLWSATVEGGRCYARLSPDGTQVAVGGRDGHLTLLDADSGALQHHREAHEDTLYWPCYSPDGSRLVSVGRDTTARLWHPGTGDELLTLQSHGGWIFRAAFSPDGRWLATAASDRRIRVFLAPTPNR